MKTIYFISCLILLSFSLTAQTEKGTFSVGLHTFSPSGLNVEGLPLNLFGRGTGFGLAIGTTKTKIDGKIVGDTENLYTLGLNLNGNYFIMDNFSVGFGGSFFSGFTAYYNGGSENERFAATIILGGPEMRYYVGKGKTRLRFTGSTALGALHSWENKERDSDPIHLFQIAAGAGISYFLTQNLSFDFGAEANVFKLKFAENHIGINQNLALDLGFGLFF